MAKQLSKEKQTLNARLKADGYRLPHGYELIARKKKKAATKKRTAKKTAKKRKR